jgi:hypothetical protein
VSSETYVGVDNGSVVHPGSAATRREGVQEERAAEAKEDAARAEEQAERKRREAAEVGPESERGERGQRP